MKVFSRTAALLTLSAVCVVCAAALSQLRLVPAFASSAGSSIDQGVSSSMEVLSRLVPVPSSRERELVAVVIENHDDARPHHRGLEDALLIEEFFVEGMITRFVVLFDRDRLPSEIGPIRSLRPYLLTGVLPWTDTIVHAGGSPEAFELAASLENVVNYNGLGLPKSFHRDKEIAAPHNFFQYGNDLTDLLAQQGEMRKVRWPPYQTGRAPSGGSGAVQIGIDFSSSLHDVVYTYDSWERAYIRENGLQTSPVMPRNVLILEMPILGVGEHGRLTINTVGFGDALLFQSGRVQRGHWSRETIDDAFSFIDDDGDPLVFSSGLTWMTVVERMNRVDWES